VYMHRLYHQTTVKIEALLSEPYFQENGNFLSFYKKFIRLFADKANPLTHAMWVLKSSRQIQGA